ncbi:hypothetical protein NQZ68_027443 [Dissostichus eleginoides]|nr:hypothetical protein NQZ68_027443 [Dissostichus eleginoides]
MPLKARSMPPPSLCSNPSVSLCSNVRTPDHEPLWKPACRTRDTEKPSRLFHAGASEKYLFWRFNKQFVQQLARSKVRAATNEKEPRSQAERR